MVSQDDISTGALASRARFPIPGAPVLSRASFRRRGRAPLSVLDAGQSRLVTSGRIAIGLALGLMGIKPGDRVLVPAYHSPSMIPPVLWRGATPVFYRVFADASVDLDDVKARLDPSVRAIMVTNYFGFPQPLARIRAFCDAHGLQLLEDCAHCFLGEVDGKPVGSYGDYAIASSMKFFPMYEGGCLVSARHPLDAVALRSAGLGFEAKIALNSLEKSFAHGRLGAVRVLLRIPLSAKSLLWGLLKRRHAAGPAAPALAPGSSDSGYDFEPGWIDKRSSLFSRVLLRVVSRSRMGALRRSHYLKLQLAVTGLPACRPLHAALPEGVYPWLFPLLVDQPQKLTAALAAAGVPYVRFGETLWPGIDENVCPASAQLGRQMVGLPCHQELSDAELGRVIAALREGLA